MEAWHENHDRDYINLLCNYIELKDKERFTIQFKKMLVRMIACALDRNYFNKHAFILVGSQQNTGKSSLLRWICPPALRQYYTENFIRGKDGEIALSDNFIINLDELSALSRIEINALKSCFSRLFIRQRRPFDKGLTNFPRRANFFGSTNDLEFLTDASGSVRWLCFEVNSINWNYQSEINIDDVWRQAYTLYKAGFRFELSKEEIEDNEIANRTYFVEGIEVNLIQKYFTSGTKEKHDSFKTTTDLLQMILTSEQDLKNQINANKIGRALRYLGFERGQQKLGQYPIKGYYVNQVTKI